MRGFGTIVTGTLVSGTINLDDELIVYPKDIKTRVRNIQVHEERADTAYAGQRTALNLSNVKPGQIWRGDVPAKPGSMQNTLFIDAKINLLPHAQRQLKYWDRVRLYLGCKEMLARIVLMEGQAVNPGESAYCQLRLEEPVAVKKGDRFVIRCYSPMKIIGGGVILDPCAKKHAANEEILKALQIKEKGETIDIVEGFVAENKEKPTMAAEVAAHAQCSEKEASELLAKLVEQGVVVEIGGYYHRNTIELFKDNMLEILSHYHNTSPLKQGMVKEELRSKAAPSLKSKAFLSFLKIMEEEKLIKNVNSLISLFGFEIVYDKKRSAIKAEIESRLIEGKFAPPGISEITKGSKEYVEVLNSLIGYSVIKLDEQTVIHAKYYEEAIDIAVDFIKKNREMSLADFRDITGSSRKYSMLILEDFDKKKITRRVENKRVLYNME
jgi:selenocysteine-specific elongation factor